MKKNIIDISIIVSTFNTKKLLKKNISSIYEAIKDLNFEVIVIDDASNDNTTEMVINHFPKVKLITNKKNLGYSKSYNLGTKAAKGKYILHLNSDVLFQRNSSFKRMIDIMEYDKNVGIIGCKIIKSNGKLDLPCKRSLPTPANIFFQSIGLAKLFPKNKYFGNYYLTYLDDNQTIEVGCIMGAFMFVKKEVFNKIGYLDENFFMYGEDVDFCYRAKKNGWKIIYFPKIKIKHLHGGTTSNSRFKYIWHFHYSMFQYYNKHHAKKNIFLLNIIIYEGIIFRFLLVSSLVFFNSMIFKFSKGLNKS